jgi:hypothetical protein
VNITLSPRRSAQGEPSCHQAGTWQSTRTAEWRLTLGRIVLSTKDADRKREQSPRARVGLAWLDAVMDQLHGAHECGRPAQCSGPTRDVTERRAARWTPGRVRAMPAADKGQRRRDVREATTTTELLPRETRRQGRRQFREILGKGRRNAHLHRRPGGALEVLTTGSALPLGPTPATIWRENGCARATDCATKAG